MIQVPPHADALSSSTTAKAAVATPNTASTRTVAYKALTISGDLGVTVPVACWFPTTNDGASTASPRQARSIFGVPCNPFGKGRSSLLTYEHRISVRRIGELLAGWDFIPSFVSKDYALAPAFQIADGSTMELPKEGPVVLLAHGYLGSRFDLSHLAEKLAGEGFTCFAPEYPESLAASFDRREGLDRRRITDTLLKTISSKWKVQPSTYGIVGHSLGCGTVLATGDDTWTRVCIAGFPRNRDGTPIPGNVLLLSSMNDGAVSLARIGGKKGIPSDFTVLEEDTLTGGNAGLMPSRAAIIFDRPDAPNHISFLAENVNDAMIEFLSPLLPVAQALSIPVLDFDRYQKSRDSRATAAVVHPIVAAYLKQQMLK